MKATIKKLSKEIDRILQENSEANYYNGLFDAGEWSQTGPDFRGLIKRWSLTRDQLLRYCEIAEANACLWFDHYPHKHRKGYEPPQGNKWYDILQNLHCIFMTGELQEE